MRIRMRKWCSQRGIMNVKIVLYFFCALRSSLTIAGANEAIVFKVLRDNVLDVRYGGKWGQICAKEGSFDTKIAGAICQQMGMELGSSQVVKGESVPLSQLSIDKVECNGTAIDSCSFSPATSCSKCPANFGSAMSVSLSCQHITDAHLVNGSDPHSGVVEIVRGAERGVVCYDSTNVANVACKQMGYSGGTATSISKPAGYTGKSFDATCASGTEANLDGCSVSGAGSACNSILHVQCTLTNASQIIFDVRLSQSSKVIAGATSGTVEVFQYGKWGVICDTGWSISAANVVCRQLGFNGAVPSTGFPTKAKFGQGTGTVFWNNIECTGEEPSIAECKHDEVFGTGACNSVNASGVICSSETLPTFDICSDKTITIPAGVSFLRSPGYPNLFDYDNGTTCSCTTTNLSAATNLTLYIHQKMFQQNHVESLTFYNGISQIRLYGDDSLAGPFSFKHMDKFTIQFESDKSAGEGMFNIQIKASAPVSFTCNKGQTTTPSVTAPITVHGLTTAFPAPKYVGNSDTGNNAGVAAAVTGVVIVLLVVIPEIILWRLGYIRFGRKARNSDGNERYDVSRVANGTTAAERAPENYVNVGDAYENVGEPVYVNSAFVADQPTNASQGSSDDHTNYENMGDVAFNQEQHSGNTTALAEPEQGSIVDRNHGNGANNSGADEGESQYAKLEPVQRSEYADLRGLTAEQLKPF